MVQRLINNWWLLILCGAFDAAFSAMIFFMQRPDGSRRSGDYRTTLVQMGILVLGAGICTIAAGVWSYTNRQSWLLVVNGLACAILGLLFTLWTRPLGFRTIALLIVVMAITLGIYVLATASIAWRAAGLAAFGFALVFLAFVFRWTRLWPVSLAESLFWIGSFFAFSAICMFALGLRLKHLRPALPVVSAPPLPTV